MQSLEIVNVYKVKLFRELYFIVILIYDIYRILLITGLP